MNYIYGEGVDRDLPRAYMWLKCAQQIPDSHDDLELNAKSRIKFALGNLKQRMTPEQISEGEKLFHEWLAAYQEAHKPAH
jgi:TPR repeat protein